MHKSISFLVMMLLLIGCPNDDSSQTTSGGIETVTITIPGSNVNLTMVQIPAGSFLMGSPGTEPDRSSIENYRTANGGTVTMSSFWMGKYPVTQAQYKAVMNDADPSNFKGDDLPVEQVSWYDAIVFCNTLSMMEGLTPAYRISSSTDPSVWGAVPISNNATWNAVEIVSGSTGYRLPTEAQWEYACRAGTTTAFNTGVNITTSQANYDGRYPYNASHDPAGLYRETTTAVGTFAANGFGLYDMHGNVQEWCWDRYTASYNSAGGSNNPLGASSGSDRVYRGGSWLHFGRNIRSAVRFIDYPYNRFNNIGFRLARP
ncbi:MAG: formylglycine-generating enzyme family protein [Treponema sp.]|nr:formylglycine-generating enzyme family protein [Treponema sp.]